MNISKIRLLNQNYNIKDAEARNQIEEINSDLDFEKSNRSILIGDSYFDYSPDETIAEENRYWYKFFKMCNISDYYAYFKGGIGFYQKVNNENFQSILENHYNDIPNKDTIKYIFVFGGYNDSYENAVSVNDISNSINNFVVYCKNNYPNAKVIIGEIGYDTRRNQDGSNRRHRINSKVIPAYSNTSFNTDNPYVYLPNLNYCLHNIDLMSSDGIHPNTIGHNYLASAIYNAFNKGYNENILCDEYVNCTAINNNSTPDIELYVKNNIPLKNIRINRFNINWNSDYPSFSHNVETEIASFESSKLLIPTYRHKFSYNLSLS